MTEDAFIKDLTEKSNGKLNIMSLDDINEHLSKMGIRFLKRGMAKNEFTVLNVKAAQEFEGMSKIAVMQTIPPGEKTPERVKNYLLYGEIMDSVVTPIILKNGESYFFVLVNQSRFPLAGKVSIEVLRGFVDKEENIENRSLMLIQRKMPSLNVIAKLVKSIHLGSFFENTGISSVKLPVNALFYETKVTMDDAQIKHELTDKHLVGEDPITGPALHNVEPVIKPFNEVFTRVDTIVKEPLKTANEYYINDFFSITAVSLLKMYLEENSLPY